MNKNTAWQEFQTETLFFFLPLLVIFIALLPEKSFDILIEKFTNWLESIAQPCFYVKFLGSECPGCGTQRAIIELLRGNVMDSVAIFPALIPGLILLLLLLFHLVFKLKHGALLIKILFIFNVIIMVLNYIYKLITP